MDGTNMTSFTLPGSLFTGTQPDTGSAPAPDTALIRVFHGSPGTPAVDVYANGSLIAKNLAYGEMTSFIGVSPGTLNIRAFPAGEMSGALINTRIALSPAGVYTIAVTGVLPNIGIRTIPEARTLPLSGTSNIRVINLSPDVNSVDVVLADGTVLQRNVRFRDITNFIPAAPGAYILKIRISGSEKVVLTIPNVSLLPGVNYTVLITGLAGQRPRLRGVVLQDGSSPSNVMI